MDKIRLVDGSLKMQVLEWVTLCTVACATAGCVFFPAFLFPASHSYELIDLPVLHDSQSSGFEIEPGEGTVLRSLDHAARVTAIQECDIDKPTPPLTRTRQLFVGFKEVKLPAATLLDFGGTSVQRTSISASLDDVLLSVVDYSFRKEACAFDIILWTTKEESSPNSKESFEQSKRLLEAALPRIVPDLVR